MNVSLMLVLYLMLSVGCADELVLETKTVTVGDDVFLNCTRQESGTAGLFWTRLVSGSLPEVLGATFEFESRSFDAVNQSHITTKQEPETFVLHISKTKLSDTGFYYCLKVNMLTMMFLKRTFLRFEGKHHLKQQYI